MDATNSYRSLKIRVTKQAQEIEAWQSKMEVMKRESGKALRENSLLHVELIKKDEACDERLRAAAAEQRKLEDQVAELHFWKQQQTERHLELEKNHEGVKAKLNDVITGSYAFSKVPGEDIKARMELSEALRAAVAEGPSAAGAQTRAEALAAAADDRAAALQRRLVESEAEMARMQAEVDAAKGAVAARDGEIRRLNGLLDNAVDVDALVRHPLTYQALYELKQKGIGVSTCVGIGGDPVPGTNFIDCLREFEADPETHAMIMIGEIGGSAEEEAAEFIRSNVTKPMSAYIAGVTAPPGKKMGHAGAIVSGGKGTAQGKMDALADAGVKVGLNPTEAGELMAQIVAGLG